MATQPKCKLVIKINRKVKDAGLEDSSLDPNKYAIKSINKWENEHQLKTHVLSRTSADKSSGIIRNFSRAVTGVNLFKKMKNNMIKIDMIKLHRRKLDERRRFDVQYNRIFDSIDEVNKIIFMNNLTITKSNFDFNVFRVSTDGINFTQKKEDYFEYQKMQISFESLAKFNKKDYENIIKDRMIREEYSMKCIELISEEICCLEDKRLKELVKANETIRRYERDRDKLHVEIDKLKLKGQRYKSTMQSHHNLITPRGFESINMRIDFKQNSTSQTRNQKLASTPAISEISRRNQNEELKSIEEQIQGRAQKIKEVDETIVRVRATKECLGSYEIDIKSKKQELKEFVQDQSSYYHHLLKQGFDCRIKGLRWIIHRLLTLKIQPKVDDLPDFLNTRQKEYLLKVGQLDHLKSQTLKKLSLLKVQLRKEENKAPFLENTLKHINLPKIATERYEEEISGSNIFISAESEEMPSIKTYFNLNEVDKLNILSTHYKSELTTKNKKLISSKSDNYIKTIKQRSLHPYLGTYLDVDDQKLESDDDEQSAIKERFGFSEEHKSKIILKLRTYSLNISKEVENLFNHEIAAFKQERALIMKTSAFDFIQKVEFDLKCSAIFGTYMRH